MEHSFQSIQERFCMPPFMLAWSIVSTYNIQSTVSATPLPLTDAEVSKSSHGSQPVDALHHLLSFAPNNNVCTQEMTNVIKMMYDYPWPSYKKILFETRERWFQKWVDKEYNLIIRKIYDHRMGWRLQQMLEEVYERRDHLTS
ncbi:hypothetical protein Ahy_A08g041136 [Arachis hypogaea]|uniref:Uncharacterized protein n=1 Tax=Arachis hypogaea TaxID=3818 RepID=A0A445C1R5_ARAHY|nr:hypothetical protein Ahy_A08g041136 [Arachis hypogaea]